MIDALRNKAGLVTICKTTNLAKALASLIDLRIQQR